LAKSCDDTKLTRKCNTHRPRLDTLLAPTPVPRARIRDPPAKTKPDLGNGSANFILGSFDSVFEVLRGIRENYWCCCSQPFPRYNLINISQCRSWP
jgi:hypothetical protein